MKIPSKDVIQADSPEREMQTIEAVAQGAKSDGEIAKRIGDVDARQGRYYRRAGEILGFLRRDAQNRSSLTALGREYVGASVNQKRDLMTRALLMNPLIQRLIPFLEAKGRVGVSRPELERFLADVAELGTRSMAHRRASSYIHWLRAFGLAEDRRGNFVLQPLPAAIPLVHYNSDDEPMFPSRYDLKEYDEQAHRVAGRGEAITYFVDEAKRERANTSHEMLIKLMAEKLRQRGAVPKANRYIDLSARWQGNDYLFEMKSTTKENSHSQIRRGLSQLYEYRYIQNVEGAKLVLVVENPLPRKLAWIENYLISDRGIFLVWDGNGLLACSPNLRKELTFL